MARVATAVGLDSVVQPAEAASDLLGLPGRTRAHDSDEPPDIGMPKAIALGLATAFLLGRGDFHFSYVLVLFWLVC